MIVAGRGDSNHPSALVWTFLTIFYADSLPVWK